ncbi:uncharacterized protein LOC141640976 [Silene latifolia]|uniref:uncharacterized protein LOC141640976 n=1 Tax=Silene latifolia TaxID=37657 RepID=UPI003D789697
MEEREKAFKELKCYLSTPPLLAKPEHGDPLFLYLSVTEAATRYTPFEKLVLALVTAPYKLSPYFEFHTIHVVTNYPPKTIMRKLELSGRMTKWSVHLSGYDLQFEPRTIIKSQALSDFVSDFCPATRVEAKKGMLTLLGDQESGTCTLYIDGASNARGARGIQMAQGLKVKNLRVYSDSLVVVTDVNNEYVPRDQNAEADALATLGATFQHTELSNIPITHVLTPAILKELERNQPKETVHVQHINRAGILVSDENQQMGPDWRKPYMKWLKDGKLPEVRKEPQSFRIKASRFVLIDSVLFRRSLAKPYLRFLNREEANPVLQDVHSGECGNHAGGRSLSTKILRQGYFWPIMRVDAVNHAKRCDSCKKAAPTIH